MALSNPQRTVVEAELAAGVTGLYGFLYQLIPSADGAKLLARIHAAETDGNVVPVMGVLDCPTGKEPNAAGPQVAALPGETASFTIDGTARALIHVKTKDCAQNAELYIGTAGGTTGLKLVNDLADTPAATLSGNLDSHAKLLGYVGFVRGQYLGADTIPHGGGTIISVQTVRVFNNPPAPA